MSQISGRSTMMASDSWDVQLQAANKPDLEPKTQQGQMSTKSASEKPELTPILFWWAGSGSDLMIFILAPSWSGD